jgi:hypothetical protein
VARATISAVSVMLLVSNLRDHCSIQIASYCTPSSWNCRRGKHAFRATTKLTSGRRPRADLSPLDDLALLVTRANGQLFEVQVDADV